MVRIDKLTTTPETVASGKAKAVTFSWEASIGEGDNPVEIELTIEEETPVFFLDVDNNEVKTVAWKTSDFKRETDTFEETLFIKVTQSQSKEKESVITMDAKDKKSASGSTDCSITYK
jgi:hypothetical protein